MFSNKVSCLFSNNEPSLLPLSSTHDTVIYRYNYNRICEKLGLLGKTYKRKLDQCPTNWATQDGMKMENSHKDYNHKRGKLDTTFLHYYEYQTPSFK